MLITFEGIDGAGKTTIARMTLNFLKQKGVDAVLFREPGGTKVGEIIREVLLNLDVDPLLELLLFEASRRSLVVEKIIPSLREGKTVILDRFCDSTLAYQGFGRGIELSFVRKLNYVTTQGLEPDLTFLLDLDPLKAIERVREKTRFENLEFLKKVREGFLKIASEEKRIILIDADRPIEYVFNDVRERIEESIK